MTLKRTKGRAMMGFALSISSTLLFSSPAGLAAQEWQPSAPDYAVLRKGNSESTLQVEIYLDLSSKESAAAWPIITDAVREFDDSVEFIYRLSPLPDQYSAFAIAQAVQLARVYARGDETLVEAFIEKVARERRLEEDPVFLSHWGEMTPSDLSSVLSTWAAEANVATADEFKRGMSCTGIKERVRREVEHASRRGVSSTPTIFVNGERSGLLSGRTSLSLWRAMLLRAADDASESEEESTEEGPLYLDSYDVDEPMQVDYSDSDDLAPSISSDTLHKTEYVDDTTGSKSDSFGGRGYVDDAHFLSASDGAGREFVDALAAGITGGVALHIEYDADDYTARRIDDSLENDYVDDLTGEGALERFARGTVESSLADAEMKRTGKALRAST